MRRRRPRFRRRSARDPRLDKKKLHRAIDKDIAAGRKATLRKLRADLASARAAERNACGTARQAARVRIKKLRERRATINAAIQREIARARAVKDSVCTTRGRTANAKKAWEEERTFQASLKRSAQSAKAKARPGLRSTRGQRASESDDEVVQNIPSHLVPLWKKVKRGIKGNARKSRTEAFMQYVEENPREVHRYADDATDALIADLERQNRAGRRRDVSLSRRDPRKSGPLYYTSYKEALVRAKRMAKETSKSIRVSLGSDSRMPARAEYAVSQLGTMPSHFYEVARVQPQGTVHMSGSRYNRMKMRQTSRDSFGTGHPQPSAKALAAEKALSRKAKDYLHEHFSREDAAARALWRNMTEREKQQVRRFLEA